MLWATERSQYGFPCVLFQGNTPLPGFMPPPYLRGRDGAFVALSDTYTRNTFGLSVLRAAILKYLPGFSA